MPGDAVRVCLYSHSFPPSVGGIETVSGLLAEHLHQRGIAVTVVTHTPGNGAEEKGPYRIVRKPCGSVLARLVASQDLVHCNGMSVTGAFTAFRCGVPLIVTHQSYNSAVPRSVAEMREMLVNEGLRRLPHAVASALAMRVAEVNACISRFVLSRLRPPRGLVLVNPVSGIFQPRPGMEQANNFTFVGRLVADKGCDIFLRALADCARRGYRYAAEIYGDGPERERLVSLAEKCGVSPRVRFSGIVQGTDLANAYHRSLAVVVPSVWQEPLGIVALEAMACGRAVIASAGGGLGEIVDGVGLTFPNGDVGALADCMIRLAQNPDLRRETERRGARFAKQCRIDTIGDAYLNLYLSALERKGTKQRKVLERGAA